MSQRELAISYHRVEELVPYAQNARTHSPGQIGQIIASIGEFGFTNPVLIDETGGIIAGHGRVMAARKMHLEEVPCIVLEGLTEQQKRAYVIADNKLALNAGWNLELLRLELAVLREGGFQLDLTGFSGPELQELLTPITGHSDPDDSPDPPVVPVARPGDLWLLGRHRLVCGDCTVAGDVMRCLGGAQPHLMVTDPPYGVEYEAGWRNEAMPQKNDPNRWKDNTGPAVGRVQNDDRADWRQAWHLFPGDVAYVWHADKLAPVVAGSLTASEFVLRAQIIWAKNQLVVGRGNYHSQHEPCWYAVRKGKTGHWEGDRKQTTVWQIDKPRKSETGHSTQKPIECMKRPIENNSKLGDSVYEPFCGSGTTIIAGEMTGRTVYAMEIDPCYIDVSILRWQAFTGRVATCEGRSYAEVQAERIPAHKTVEAPE